jgi:hypothetical protein
LVEVGIDRKGKCRPRARKSKMDKFIVPVLISAFLVYILARVWNGIRFHEQKREKRGEKKQNG